MLVPPFFVNFGGCLSSNFVGYVPGVYFDEYTQRLTAHFGWAGNVNFMFFCYILFFVAILNFCFSLTILVSNSSTTDTQLSLRSSAVLCFFTSVFLNLSQVCFSPVSRRLRTRRKQPITSERRYVYAFSCALTVVCDCGSYPPWEVLGRMQTKTWRLITTLVYIFIPREGPYEQVKVEKHKADAISSYPCCPLVLFMAQQTHQERMAKYILWLSTVRIFSSAYTAW